MYLSAGQINLFETHLQFAATEWPACEAVSDHLQTLLNNSLCMTLADGLANI